MDVRCLYLFVYGTLLDADNGVANFMRKHCSFVKPGKFKGILYDIGEYPGAVSMHNAAGYVHGSIYLMSNAPLVLEKLDDYEGFGPGQEQPNLFVRKLLEIETITRSFDCWTYLYNKPVEKLRVIENGDYLNR
jgi:gamma-glutamylcyclotransferase (GGCT)/AIG2-like uncharacterized protein YtfP